MAFYFLGPRSPADNRFVLITIPRLPISVCGSNAYGTLSKNLVNSIKELQGVDFVINSRPLTKKEEVAISKYSKTYKAKHSIKEI